ncbi:hypothetical protein F5Y13DRAFT_202217 [Hypoxylon sp. FL1857]|nr:hypothetical protein F5Y13DRAFT_202217 [Hypoxylon sp. FL1857]
MPASSRTQQIPQQEWERRKDQIIKLYITDGAKLLGDNGVIKIMEKDGFVATKSQYEHQFRQWEVHKNMRRHERDRAIQQRKQRLQRGDPTPITLAGRVIPNCRIDRAERLRRGKRPQIQDPVLRDNDRVAQGNPTPQISTAEFDSGSISNTAIHAETDEIDFDIQVPELTNDINDMPYPEIPSAFFGGVDNVDTIDFTGFGLPAQEGGNLTLGPPLLPGNSTLSIENFDFQLPSGDIPNFDETLFSQLPLQSTSLCPGTELIPTVPPGPLVLPHQHEQIWPKNWMKLSFTKIGAVLMEDIYGKIHHTPFWDTARQSIACQFLASIDSGQSESSPTRIPKDLFAARILIGEEHYQFAKLSNEDATEALFYTRVISSIANGFSGLGNMPPIGILRFLNGRQDILSSMMGFLRLNSSSMAKSLAENIFRAALQSDNADIVQYLLDHTGLVDINETVCSLNGGRYTPVKMAAEFRSFGVIRILVSRNIDINRVSSDMHRPSVLLTLIYGEDGKKTLDETFLKSVDACLNAGAEVSVDCIKCSLSRFTDPRLAMLLIEKAVFQIAEELISNDRLLKAIVENFEEQHAASMIRLIMQNCKNSPEIPSIVLYEAVKRGYQELVGTVIPNTRFLNTPNNSFFHWKSQNKIARVAKGTGNQAIIELIIRNHPDLSSGKGSYEALIAALAWGDQKTLRSLEGTDLLNRLRGSYKLGKALESALHAGNLEYATKILEVDPDFDFVRYFPRPPGAGERHYDEAAALNAALTHGFDDIAWKLFAVGMRIGSGVSPRTLLHAAVTNRKREFVKAVVEFRFDPQILCPEDDSFPRLDDDKSPVPHRERNLILEAALEWDDDSVINDIWQARGNSPISISKTTWRLALKKGRKKLFIDMVKSCFKHKPSLKLAVEAAVEYENLPLLDELIALGAEADDDQVLEYAIRNQPSMIKPLLERFQKAFPQGRVGYGQFAILQTISRYPQSSESLDIFFEFNLMTMNFRRGDCDTPLSMAIWKHGGGRKINVIPLLKRLLHAGSDVNSIIKKAYGTNGSKTTALLEAVGAENTEIVQLLIDYGAEINTPARFGLKHTPLQEASAANNLEIVTLLLNNNADVNALPAIFDGATALQFAAIHGNFEMATMLMRHGARLNVPPSNGIHGRWPLEGAAENGRLDMIQLFWEANGGPFDEKQCQKAMRLAEKNGYLGCRDLIRELMEKSCMQVSMRGAE